MLTPEERTAVREALFRVLNRQADARAFLAGVVFSTEASKVPGELPSLPGPAEYATETITVCMRYAAESQLVLLETLLRYLADFQGEGALAALADRVHQGTDPNPKPFDDLWMDIGQAFFDRSALRKPLGSLVTSKTRPILRINAPEGAYGRSFSIPFISHVAGRVASQPKVIAATISRGAGPSYGIADLGETLLFQIPSTDPLPPRSGGSSYPASVVRFLLARMLVKPNPWIIVLDAFGQPDVQGEVREAVESFASMIANLPFRDQVRLVLTDYPGQLPGVSAANILEENLVPADQIGEADLAPVVLEIGRLRAAAGRAGVPEDQVPAVVQGVLAAAAASGKQRMEDLAAQLVRVWEFDGP
ncbi:MAG TPA: hypothetical protein VES19_13880 [Candidatus Limnocylindrales bacterium]|nr:hypothetical protein [Candidatus Limnocylindrales bacterium]